MKAKKFLSFMSMLVFSSAIFVNAAEVAKDGEQSELNADEVEYDMNTGIATATGNVLLKHGTGTATGSKAIYNVNTQEAHLIDKVIVVRDNLKLTCNSLHSDGAGYMQADGNVYAEQKIEPNEKYPEGDLRTFNGEHVDYYPDDRRHIIIPSGGITKSKDGTFTADHMEGWLDDEYYVGTGNAHLVSPPRNLEAGGDRVDYYAQDNGKAILTGNAWAYQDNNTIRGNRLVVYLADDKQLKAEKDPNPFADKKSVRKQPLDNNESVNKPFGSVYTSDNNLSSDVNNLYDKINDNFNKLKNNDSE